MVGDPLQGRYFVAAAGMELLGQFMHTWEWSDWRNGMLWWLQSVYVRPEHRRRGVFRRLVEHVRFRKLPHRTSSCFLGNGRPP